MALLENITNPKHDTSDDEGTREEAMLSCLTTQTAHQVNLAASVHHKVLGVCARLHDTTHRVPPCWEGALLLGIQKQVEEQVLGGDACGEEMGEGDGHEEIRERQGF